MLEVSERRYNLVTHTFFALMAIFAIVFANERFQADGAYYLFKVVNFESFQVEHQRFILVFSQALPLLGAKLGLSMKIIILLNSLSNVLFFYLIFRYVAYYLRDQTGGVLVILFQVVGVLHIHFTPMYEIWYGTMLLVPLRSHLVTMRYVLWKDLFVIALLMVTILFSHPLLFIPVIFILLLDAVEKAALDFRLLAIAVVVFAGWYIVKKLFLSSYEAGKISMLDTSWNKAYLDLLRPSYYWGLIRFFAVYYTIPLIVYLLTMGFYIIRRIRIKAMLVSVFFLGHILLVNFTHVNDNTLTPYFERMYMPLLPIVFFPFVYDFFTQFFLRNMIGMILLVLIICWRIGRMVDVGLEYKAHTRLVDKAVEQAEQKPGSKFELNPDDSRWCMNWADWSLAMETQLRSSAIGGKTVAISVWDDFDEPGNRWRLDHNDKEYMMRRYEIMPDASVNPKYFRIEHGHYQTLDQVCR
jgi:hypothetical protein